MKQPEIAGLIIGSVACVIAVILLMTGKIPELGQWEIVIGAVVIIIILGSFWKVTRGWLVPILFGAAIVLIASNYLLTEFLVPNAKDQGPLLGLALFGIIVDAVIFVLLTAILILQIRGLITWLRESKRE
jgi:hypothetical protein